MPSDVKIGEDLVNAVIRFQKAAAASSKTFAEYTAAEHAVIQEVKKAGLETGKYIADMTVISVVRLHDGPRVTLDIASGRD